MHAAVHRLNIIISSAMSARLQQHSIHQYCYSIKMNEMDISDEECCCTSYYEYKYFVEACIRAHGINDVQTIVDAMLERDEPTEIISKILEHSEYTILNILLHALFSFPRYEKQSVLQRSFMKIKLVAKPY